MNNEKLFKDELNHMHIEEFARFISAPDKCLRCSNYYWDGSQSRCHKNINDSSCVEGTLEWLESDNTDDLQSKYHKKYFTFKDKQSADIGKKILHLIYSTGMIEKLYDNCYGCTTDNCIEADCSTCWWNLILMQNRYIREIQHKMDPKNTYEIQKFEEKYRVLTTWLQDVIVPYISDISVKDQVIQCINQLQELK